MKKLTLVLAPVALLCASSCKKIEKIANEKSTQGSLSAMVDGKPYVAGRTTIFVVGSDFSMTGSTFSNDEEIQIEIENFNNTSGKYPVAMYSTAYRDLLLNAHNAISGEVELEMTGGKSAKGTFHFETDDSIKVTDGKFDIKWE